MTKRQAILNGLSEILEEEVLPDTELNGTERWDSLSIVMTIGLLDDHTGKMFEGVALMNCKTVEDLLVMAGVTE